MEQQRKSSQARIDANKRYNQKTYRRTTVSMKPDEMEKLMNYCIEHNISKNAFILSAIKEKLERDNSE